MHKGTPPRAVWALIPWAVLLLAACQGPILPPFPSTYRPPAPVARPVVAAPAAAAPVGGPGGAAAAAVGTVALATPTEVHGKAGQALYMRYCTLCHGAVGQGYAADNAPSLISRSFRESANEGFLRMAIVRGRPGTAMAGYGKEVGGPMSPEEMNDLLSYLQGGAPKAALLPDVKAQGDVTRGQTIFETQCGRCHGTPAQRNDAVHLFNPLLMASATDAFLRHAIEQGRPGTRMEAWAGKLAPQQIDDVIAYLRATPSVPAPLPPTPPMPPAAPRTGPVVINPNGKLAEFHLRDERFAPLDEVKAALDQKRRIVICDARAPSDFLTLHIEGAVSTPYYDTKSLDDIPNDDNTWVIAYCACPHHASGEVVDQLRKRGYKHTAVLDEGVFAWQHKNYPVVSSSGAPVPNSPAPPPMPAVPNPNDPPRLPPPGSPTPGMMRPTGFPASPLAPPQLPPGLPQRGMPGTWTPLPVARPPQFVAPPQPTVTPGQPVPQGTPQGTVPRLPVQQQAPGPQAPLQK